MVNQTERPEGDVFSGGWLDKETGHIRVVDGFSREDLVKVAEEAGVPAVTQPKAYEERRGVRPSGKELRRRIAVNMAFNSDFMKSPLSDGQMAPLLLITGRWDLVGEGIRFENKLLGVKDDYFRWLVGRYKQGDALKKAEIVNEIVEKYWPSDEE